MEIKSLWYHRDRHEHREKDGTNLISGNEKAK